MVHASCDGRSSLCDHEHRLHKHLDRLCYAHDGYQLQEFGRQLLQQALSVQRVH